MILHITTCLKIPLLLFDFTNFIPGSAWYRDPSTREWKVISLENVDVGTPATEADIDKVESLLPGDSDYVSHHVQPTDTLQGICLKVSNLRGGKKTKPIYRSCIFSVIVPSRR